MFKTVRVKFFGDLQNDITLNKSKALAVLASQDMYRGGDQPVPCSILENVIPPKTVTNIPPLVQEVLASSCQSDLVAFIWDTAGRMIHMLR